MKYSAIVGVYMNVVTKMHSTQNVKILSHSLYLLQATNNYTVPQFVHSIAHQVLPFHSFISLSI